MKNDKKQNKTSKIPDLIEDDNKMTDKRMKDLLVEFHGSIQWDALKRLMNIEMIKAENSLCTVDPFKEPTIAARNQGIRMGIYSLEKYIEDEINNRKEKNSGEEDKLPNYNNF